MADMRVRRQGLDGTTVLGLGGVAAVVAGAVLVLVLHVVAPSSAVDAVHRTISEYALLSNGWVFDSAVWLVGLGSAAIVATLVRGRLLAGGSLATLLFAGWTLGLTVIVVFPKHGRGGGSVSSASVHRLASLVAFLVLPAAALLLAAAWRRDPRWRRWAGWVGLLGVLAYACFAPIAWALVSAGLTGARWWQTIPLGAVERALALSEVAILVAAGLWAVSASRPHIRPGRPKPTAEGLTGAMMG